MSEFVFKLPDLGEGTVEAEIIEWHVKTGDTVREGDALADVMTEKANIEVPAPVSGTVLRTTGQPGDLVAVGAELAAFSTSGATAAATSPATAPESVAKPVAPPPERERAASATAQGLEGKSAKPTASQQPTDGKASSQATQPDAAGAGRQQGVLTSPAIRRHAKEQGVDLRDVPGTGPRGRITRDDFHAYLAGERKADAARRAEAPGEAFSEDDVEEIKVIGVRRVIARRMAQSKSEIPHFAYVEEVDVTELERLRQHLNNTHPDRPRLTLLPFIAVAMRNAVAEFPQCNARYDAEAGVLHQHRRVHLGVATQTPDGLKVPVVRAMETLDLWALATSIGAVADAAREGTAAPAALSGSTITITSLGKLGGIVTTPVINYPEVAIIGVNKAVQRPVVIDDAITVRLMMNLSSSFDHRFVDGFDAASMVQHMKAELEHPATLFLSQDGR